MPGRFRIRRWWRRLGRRLGAAETPPLGGWSAPPPRRILSRSGRDRAGAASRACWLVFGVANHAIGADGTLQAPVVMEKVQMSHRLAHGEEKLMRVELAAKQRIEHVRRGPGRTAGFMQLGQAQAVMLL